LKERDLSRIGNIAREFIKENKEFIVCEPSGKILADLEMERKAVTYMKLVDWILLRLVNALERLKVNLAWYVFIRIAKITLNLLVD